MKNLFIFILLVLAAWFGWKYLNPAQEPPPTPAAAPAAAPVAAPAIDPKITGEMQLTISKLIRYGQDDLARGAPLPIPNVSKTTASLEIKRLRRLLQGQGHYSPTALDGLLLQAALKTSANRQEADFLTKHILSLETSETNQVTTQKSGP